VKADDFAALVRQKCVAWEHRVAGQGSNELPEPRRESVSTELSAFRSPVFTQMARKLEQSVQEDADFGPFRGR
jgi:hypothetical protein